MKPFAIYGKKPRSSKTSKRDILEGIPVFLHYSSGSTGGNIICYYDKPPYPRICVATGVTYWDCRSKVEEFFSKRSLDIKTKLEGLDKNYGIPFEIIDKNNKKTQEEYEIVTTYGNKGFKLITPYYNGEYLYLYADPTYAPMKNVSGKKILDSDAILKDFLKRENNGNI